MRPSININGNLIDLSTPLVMGIVNITPDSFFQESRKQSESEIVNRVRQILEEGGRIIDIGGQSTSPTSSLIPATEEFNRLEPALRIIRKEFPDAILSVDTFYSEVAKPAVEKYGVNIINDISGGQIDGKMFDTVARLNVPYILMHMRGTPQTMQQHTGFGHLGVGWTMADYNLYGGSLRLLFSFSAGLLMTRNFKPVRIRGAFWICVLLIVILLSVPYIGDGTAPWKNGLYDAVSILIVFPLLVYLGASGKITDKKSSKLCKLLGDISYPLYAVHYPFMYLFYAWLWGNGVLFSQAWPVALLLFAGNILLAYLLLKFYDEPVRRYLTGKLRRG
jgi:hypothetical protein